MLIRVALTVTLLLLTTAVVGSAQPVANRNQLADSAGVVLVLNHQHSGSLDTTGGVLSDGSPLSSSSRFRVYRYHHDTAPGRISVRMSSRALDSYLIVLDRAGTTIDENDDDPSRNTLDARVDFPALSGQQYVIIVTSAFDGETGPFTLSAAPASPASTEGLSALSPTAYDGLIPGLDPRLLQTPRFVEVFARQRSLRCDRLRSEGSQQQPFDVLHPRRFTSVAEVTRSGEQHNLVTPGLTESVRAEVDRHSKVRIEFPPNQFPGNIGRGVAISIQAAVDSRPVEVPGYSEIGEQRRVAAAHIRNLSARHATVCTAVAYWDSHGRLLAAAAEALDGPAYVRFGQALVRHLSPELTAGLSQFMIGQDRDALATAAQLAELDPIVFLAVADRMLALLSAIGRENSQPPTGDQLRDFSDVWQRFAMRSLSIGNKLAATTKDELLSGALLPLKATEISIETTGARPGDILEIRVENRAGTDDLPRVLVVRLEVVEFGMVNRVRDIVGLARRAGVSESTNGAAASALVARVRASGVAADTTVPLPANYLATPGVTYGWTFYPRRSKGRGNAFVRWLHPGVGVSVVFPRFGEQEIRVEPNSAVPAEGGNGETVAAEPSVTTSERTDALNIAAGPSVSIFNNAVQFTTGWNLNVERKRFFWALGFSFAEIAGSAARAVGGSRD